jgi:hypothetical protein
MEYPESHLKHYSILAAHSGHLLVIFVLSPNAIDRSCFHIPNSCQSAGKPMLRRNSRVFIQ